MDTNTTHAGRAIKRERQRRGLSQDEAAVAGGTSRPTWAKIEQGGPAHEASLVAVDRAFGWPIGTTEALREGRTDTPPDDPAEGLQVLLAELKALRLRVGELDRRVGQLEP